MRKIIIVTGHGNFGTGMQSSIELLAGQNEDMKYIDFTEADTDLVLKARFAETLKKNQDAQALFVCDLLGGTPFKCAVELANDNENHEVVAGCNVGAIIEALLQKDEMSICDLAEFIIDASKNTTAHFKKIATQVVQPNCDLTMEGGI